MKQQILEQLFSVDDFYGETYLLNPETYKGRGRPRKTDYAPMTQVLQYLQKEHNKALNDYLDSVLLKS